MAFLLASGPAARLAAQTGGLNGIEVAAPVGCLPMFRQVYKANPYIGVMAKLALAQWPAAASSEHSQQFVERLGASLVGPEYQLLERVAALSREDFAEGRVITLSGWMLSEAEARFCVVLHQVCQVSEKD
jgi:hypothetical protein